LARLTALPGGTAPAAAIEVLEREGIVVLHRLIEPTAIDRILAELAPHLEAATPGGGLFYGRRAKRLYSVIARSPAFAEVITHPLLLALADAVLLPNCDRYRVQLTTALETWPGGEHQPLHRDEAVYGKYLPYGPNEREYLLSLMVAATDFTARNGATRMVPGSHRWELDRAPEEDEIAFAEMPRGSVAVYLGSVLHGMGINETDAPRTGVATGYSLGWLRTEENLYLACPPEVARDLPERAQQLLGYQVHSALLGFVDGADSELQTRPGESEEEQVAVMDEALGRER
jgi:hypothetical protein